MTTRVAALVACVLALDACATTTTRWTLTDGGDATCFHRCSAPCQRHRPCERHRLPKCMAECRGVSTETLSAAGVAAGPPCEELRRVRDPRRLEQARCLQISVTWFREPWATLIYLPVGALLGFFILYSLAEAAADGLWERDF
jgi:hypothetical protein